MDRTGPNLTFLYHTEFKFTSLPSKNDEPCWKSITACKEGALIFVPRALR
jgi:hypothetical protein